jgi:hypothetical protein
VKKLIILISWVVAFLGMSAQTVSEKGNAIPLNTGNERPLNQLELMVFPNPVLQKQFTIELSNGNISEISIANIAGQQVFMQQCTSPDNRITVKIQALPDGIYFLKVSSVNNVAKTIKLLVRSSH